MPGQSPAVIVPMTPPQAVSTNAANEMMLERIVSVTSVASARSSRYQSVSRVPASAQKVPWTV